MHTAIQVKMRQTHIHTNVTGPNRLVGSKPRLIISKDNADISKCKCNEISAQIFFHSKRPHTITKMYDQINVESTIIWLGSAHSQIDTCYECSIYMLAKDHYSRTKRKNITNNSIR
jgi:hypothetical protein